MDLKEIALHLQDFRNVYVTGNPAMLRSRTDFLDIFSAYGLAADMSVSKKTGLLIVCSDPMQKKIDRAAALNIPIISEQQWFELMPELEALGRMMESQFRLRMTMASTVLMWVVLDNGKKEEARRGQRHHLCPLLVP